MELNKTAASAWCKLAALATAVVALAAVSIGRADAQIDQAVFRADDGTAYQVIRLDLTVGLDHVKVTTIAGSVEGVGGCNISAGMSGGPAQAATGCLTGSQTLHPYAQIVRTGILSPISLGLTFDQHFGGRVSLGTGAGQLNICKSASDCTAQPNPQALIPLSSSSGGVPAACIANGVNAGCDLLNTRSTFAFGVPASGDPPTCTNPTTDVTVNTTICHTEPSDGVAIGQNSGVSEALVLIYDSSLCGKGFSVGSAGPGITAGDKAPCTGSGKVFDFQAAILAAPAQAGPCPTDTPTATPLDTATPTVTETPTATSSATPTFTATPTPTITPTATPTPICGANPRPGCRAAGTSVFLVEEGTDATRRKLAWRWNKGAATDLFALGNPVTGSTNYTLCVYGSAGGVPALALGALTPAASMCGGGFCWTPSGTRGFTYRDTAGHAAGMTKIILRTGTAGQAKVLVEGKGSNLPAITPADSNNLIRQDPSVTVQLVSSADECWESVFAGPALRTSGTLFRDRF